MGLRVFLRKSYIGAILVAIVVRTAAICAVQAVSDPIADGVGRSMNFIIDHAFRDAVSWTRFSWVPITSVINLTLAAATLLLAFLVASWLYPPEEHA